MATLYANHKLSNTQTHQAELNILIPLPEDVSLWMHLFSVKFEFIFKNINLFIYECTKFLNHLNALLIPTLLNIYCDYEIN